MGQPTADSEHPQGTAAAHARVDLRLTVWTAEDGWHALLLGPGTTRREFASPFELVRCLASPGFAAPLSRAPAQPRGLR